MLLSTKPEWRIVVSKKPILIADDEKNIRLTITQALEKLDIPIESAITGEEALEKLSKNEYALLLLDLKMPGMDGIEVLRNLRRKGNNVKVLIITAHGTVDNAVEALKLGAVDFIQKPFSPVEIRQFVENALNRNKTGFLAQILPSNRKKGAVVENGLSITLAQKEEFDYMYCIEQSKASIEARDNNAAIEWAKKAVSVDTARPEAYNYLGVLHEMISDRIQAQKYFRAALSIDATYKPAKQNLDISTGMENRTKFIFGENKDENVRVKDKGFILGSMRETGKKKDEEK